MTEVYGPYGSPASQSDVRAVIAERQARRARSQRDGRLDSALAQTLAGCSAKRYTGAMNRSWSWVLVVSTGCASNPARVEPDLLGAPSFAISNSPMRAHPQEPHVEKGRVAVTYSFLIVAKA